MNAHTHNLSMQHRSRRGAAYVLVLGASLLVFVIGASALAAMTIVSEGTEQIEDAHDAELLAPSGIEWAMTTLASDANWRTDTSNNLWSSNIPYGRGVFKWKVRDVSDADLADDPADEAQIVAKATVGGADRTYAATYIHPSATLELLKSNIHAGGDVHIHNNAVLQLFENDELISANGSWRNDGELDGSARATSVSGNGWNGTATGTVDTSADPLEMPSSAFIDNLIARATTLTYSGDIDTMLIAPGLNEYDMDAPTGSNIWYLNTNGNNITITNSRIQGTLIIDTGANKSVKIIGRVLIEPDVPSMPSLVVKGAVVIDTDGPSLGVLALLGLVLSDLRATLAATSNPLSEQTVSHNFNPPTAPYQGNSDTDTNDRYPCMIYGMVYATGNVEFEGTNWIVGLVVSEGEVTVFSGTTTVFHDSIYFDYPPDGMVKYDTSTFVMKNGSWERTQNEN